MVDLAKKLGRLGRAMDWAADKVSKKKKPKVVRIARGVHCWEYPGGRQVLRIHYGSDPEKDTPEWKAREMARQNIGPNSPEWRTEYEIDVDARRGLKVYPEYQEALHVRRVFPFTGGLWFQAAGVDYGTNAPSAFVFGSFNGLFLRIWAEHYQADRRSGWHKEACAHLLEYHLGVDANSKTVFTDTLRLTAADPTSSLDLEYAGEPKPWPHITTLGDGEKLNDVRRGEDAVRDFLARRGACCNQVLYENKVGQIDASSFEIIDLCPQCGKKVKMRPGIAIDAKCFNLRRQLRTLRRKRPRAEGEPIDDTRKLKQEDHLTDALRYLCRYLRKMIEPIPIPIRRERALDDTGGRRYSLKRVRKSRNPYAAV